MGSWNPRRRTPEPEAQPTFDQRWEGGVRASFPKSQHDFICLGSCCEKHALLERGGRSSLLAVSKPESKKAENKAALCGKAGCSVSVSILTSPPPPFTGKDKAASERYYFIACENRDMNGA